MSAPGLELNLQIQGPSRTGVKPADTAPPPGLELNLQTLWPRFNSSPGGGAVSAGLTPVLEGALCLQVYPTFPLPFSLFPSPESRQDGFMLGYECQFRRQEEPRRWSDWLIHHYCR